VSVGLSSSQEIQPRPGKGPLPASDKRILFLGLLLVLATVALYYPVSHHPFADYDDPSYVTDNLHVKYGLDWDGVKWAFTTYHSGNWHPVTWLSHALDCQLFYLNPAHHHQTNILLQALNTALLFWVLLRATGWVGRSFMVAALFALHPINVESVAWIAERKNLLSMLFFLLALGAYRWYACKPRVDRYLPVVVLFALGLMAKPQVITLPFVLLLWDYWPLGRMFAAPDATSSTTVRDGEIPPKGLSWLVLEKLPLLALSVASAIVTVKAQAVNYAMGGANWQPLSVRVGNAIVSYVRYVGKAFWPSRLAVLYPHPGNSLTAWQTLAAFVFLAIVTALVVAARRRQPYFLVGWFWFLGTLVPMIGLVQVGSQAMADRYAYLPFIGIFIMVCWGVAAWALRRRLSVSWVAGTGFVVLVALTVVSHRQIGYWKDDVALWSRAVQVTSGNLVAEDNLGDVLLNRGQLQQAIVHLRAAEAISPSDPRASLSIGFYEQQSGNLRQAIDRYQRVLDLTQSDPVHTAGLRINALTNMSYAYRDLGETARAYQCLDAARSESRR